MSKRMRPDDKRQTCYCGHRYSDHAKNGGPCLTADTPPDQRTGQGCQCHAWHPFVRIRPSDSRIRQLIDADPFLSKLPERRAIEAEAASPAALDWAQRAIDRMLRAADTDTRYWIENIVKEERRAAPRAEGLPSEAQDWYDLDRRILASEQRIVLLKAVVREATGHIERLMANGPQQPAGGWYGAQSWLAELPARLSRPSDERVPESEEPR